MRVCRTVRTNKGFPNSEGRNRTMMFISSFERLEEASMTSTIHGSGKALTGKKYKDTREDVSAHMHKAV
jgi:hypothetical protein